jgi:hypothetical protein
VSLDPVVIARRAYQEVCRRIGTDAATEENAILSVDPKFLPPCALAVLLDADAATVEYYDWLTGQTETAQAEHDAEYAAGHEWHEPKYDAFGHRIDPR